MPIETLCQPFPPTILNTDTKFELQKKYDIKMLLRNEILITDTKFKKISHVSTISSSKDKY